MQATIAPRVAHWCPGYDLRERLGVHVLPRIGCLSSGQGLEKRRMPQLVQVEPLGILLRQADNAASLHGRRNAELVPHGEEPVLQVYGTLRCVPATHKAAKVLTVRNKRELPACLFSIRISGKNSQPLSLMDCVMSRPHLGNGCRACLGGGPLCSLFSRHT